MRRMGNLVALLVLTGCTSKKESVDTSVVEENTAPTLEIASPTLGSTWSETESVRLQAQVGDLEDAVNTLHITVVSSSQGIVAEPVAALDGSVIADLPLRAGTHTLTITVADSGGLVAIESLSIRVTAASFPSQPAVQIEPAAPVSGDDLAAIILVESVDPEGDTLDYIWSWTVDGVDAAIDTSLVNGSRVEAGQTWEVTVYTTDHTSQSAAAHASVTVANGAPDPGLVSLSPQNPNPGDILTCNYSIDPPQDPEGDPVTVGYAWEVNGIRTADTGNTLDTRSNLRGDLLRCIVITDDGFSSTEWPSALVNLGNQAPVVSAVLVSPNTVVEGSTLTCRGVGSDPDGDPVSFSYLWRVNGIDVGHEATLGSEVFSKGDAIQCEATPADIYSTGTPGLSEILTVANTAPDAPSVDFVRTDIIPGVDAECMVTADAHDVDGDSLSYRWSWEVNGVASTQTTAIFDTDALSANDILTCMARADDGSDLGTAGSANLVIGTPTLGTFDAASALAIISGPSTASSFGKAVDSEGDFDADGVVDLVISASTTATGSVYVFSGATLLSGGSFTDADAFASWNGASANDSLGGGRAAVTAADVEGDGRCDLLVAAPLDDDGGTDAGTVSLIYGSQLGGFGQNINTAADMQVRGSTGDWLGTRLATDDFDGDGLTDLAMSAPYNDTGANRAGLVAVFNGGAGLNGTYNVTSADALITGTVALTELGWSLAAVGDPNGDGYQDLGSSLIYDDTNGSDAGTGVVFSGSRLTGNKTWIQASYLVVHGLGAGDRFGYDVDGVGDVDGDGIDDLLFGGYLADGVGADAGEVRLFTGATGLNREEDADLADLVFPGVAADDQAGSAIQALGDFDGDGRGDFAIGSPRATRGGLSERGVTSIYLGHSYADWVAGNLDADIIFQGDASNDWFGDELAGNLDLNGDGYGGIAVGAQQATINGVETGAVYLFQGP